LFRVSLYYSCFVFVDDFEKLIKNSCTKSKEDKAVELTTSNAIVILGSSFVGSLALPILIVWFNAVEAEVYAMASFISLFWLGLRWEQDMDSP
jgi:hypothetical protein